MLNCDFKSYRFKSCYLPTINYFYILKNKKLNKANTLGLSELILNKIKVYNYKLKQVNLDFVSLTVHQHKDSYSSHKKGITILPSVFLPASILDISELYEINTKLFWIRINNIRVFKNYTPINLNINSSNNNVKININNNKNSMYISYGMILIKFNLLIKSLRRSKKYISILVNHFKSVFENIKKNEEKNTKTSLLIRIKGFQLVASNLLIREVLNDRLDLGSKIFFKTSIKNSIKFFKKIKAIKKRIRKKLIKKLYKN